MALAHSPSIPTNGLMLYLDAANLKSYPGSGSTWTDMINAKAFSATGSPTYNSAGYFTFNGSTDYFSNSTLSSFALDLSTTLYVTYPTYAVSGGQKVNISYRSGSGGQLYIGTQSGSIFSYYDSLSTSGYVVGAVTTNAWNVCAVVTDSVNGTMSHYVNGILGGTAGSRTGFSTATKPALFIGYDPGGTNEYFQGRISQVMTYNRVLTAEEILQIFNAMRGRYGI